MFKFFSNKLQSLFRTNADINLIEYAESLFYEADFGTELTKELCARLYRTKKADESSIKELITSLLYESLEGLPYQNSEVSTTRPLVSLILGTNGSGKTTTTAKLAHYYKERSHNVMLVATDTFRAGGMDQARLWAKELGCGFVSGKPGGDAAAIAFDGIQAAIARGYSRVIIDTSGRLHVHSNLMKELSKIALVCGKALEGAPHEVLMTVDSTLGNNAVEQVRIFHDVIPLSGLIFTKVDGSAKGGTLFQIARQLQIPTKFIGYGESLKDLEEFDIDLFLEKLFAGT
ncbi:Cell division protein FtsY,signal recognition particle-docking protein FtsY,Signal recognition particle GTPase,signal recognition particle-docking protein FtsY,SRP54-type protein, GTPase domain [Chlamydia serpentis]|uniref:Signal recognition particle receptor FtsY n=1 Tax=Chlamydia serpentis TaxID=1967782 RepID=A0A2R8FCF8_9CHLA|nr:signal recognition particle-docking protein FtsY [Chlamydia serpentis]SPN74078.1 Cell division protein FtsY,signal recognition particle-docking protein FtsY,Signal recognition particle GTPase,signal recognition particle-docking protein FtsY,SRP54-type protein, GTPase domain [Chlamydia serpentis]